jgi:hypothetical protein
MRLETIGRPDRVFEFIKDRKGNSAKLNRVMGRKVCRAMRPSRAQRFRVDRRPLTNRPVTSFVLK